MTCNIRIGTSGFHYKHRREPFYPEKTPATKPAFLCPAL
jgi:uncharacterized protein YecE (DUF72 family)